MIKFKWHVPALQMWLSPAELQVSGEETKGEVAMRKKKVEVSSRQVANAIKP